MGELHNSTVDPKIYAHRNVICVFEFCIYDTDMYQFLLILVYCFLNNLKDHIKNSQNIHSRKITSLLHNNN